MPSADSTNAAAAKRWLLILNNATNAGELGFVAQALRQLGRCGQAASPAVWTILVYLEHDSKEIRAAAFSALLRLAKDVSVLGPIRHWIGCSTVPLPRTASAFEILEAKLGAAP